MIAHQLNKIMYDTVRAKPGHIEQLLKQAYQLGLHYAELKGDVPEYSGITLMHRTPVATEK
jgi:hypothetical protein